jgi:hypothetical protein
MNARKPPTHITAALTSGAATLLVTLVIGWLTLGRDSVGRAEVIELIQSRGPYVADRQALVNAITQHAVRLDELAQLTRELERQSHRVEAKLDLLLRRVETDSRTGSAQ